MEDGVAGFPDAPTERGTKHVLELIRAKTQGLGAAVIVVAQREDAGSFTPNRETDPHFSNALVMADQAGVPTYAYNCRVTPGSVILLGRITVDLGTG